MRRILGRTSAARALSLDLRGAALNLTASAFAALLLTAGLAFGQEAPAKDPNKIIKAHGYNSFAELKYPADLKHLDYVNPEAPKGGEISIWTMGTFDNFNAYSRKGRAGALATMPYESLLTASADEIATAYCLICETLEYPETEDWVIFHLRKDVTFSDGTPLTAHDVAFSHHKLLDEGLPSYAMAVRALIPLAEALDDYTVKFTFADGVPRKNLISQAGGVPIFSKAWFEKTGASLGDALIEMPPGSGPYLRQSHDFNRQIIYKRNPDYWGKDHPLMVGRANFDRIRVEYFSDSEAAMEAFKAGVYTFRAENSSLSWATRYDFPAVKNGWVKLDTPKTGDLPPAVGYVFNLKRPQFQDLRVRRALGLVFNRDWTNQNLQYGLFDQRVSFWQDSEMMAKGVAEGSEKALLEKVADLIDPAIRDEVLTGEAFLPHQSNADRQMDRRNLRAAGQLLDEAGWLVEGDGIRRKDGKTLDIEILGDNPSFDRIIEPYVQNLQQLGVKATYNRVDSSQYTARERDFDWDMIYDGYNNSLEEGIGLTQRFGSDGLGDLFNPASYASPAVDELAKYVVAATSYEEMATAVRAIDRILRASYFVVPTWYKNEAWLAYYDMFRHPEPLPLYDLGYLDFWWYDEGRAAELKAAGALR